MSAPPEAKTEYSRGSGLSGRAILPRLRASSTAESARRPALGTLVGLVALGALLGALLVIVAQFTALYRVQSATSSAVLRTVGTGANHAWAPIPLALLAGVLAFAVYRHGNRSASVALAALGIATLLIALLGDLRDARASGLIGSSAGGYVQAVSGPSAGLYMETLGAVVLLAAGGLGLLLPTAPPRQAPQD
jgi:hypothetical protein